jgi:hypothetical protein
MAQTGHKVEFRNLRRKFGGQFCVDPFLFPVKFQSPRRQGAKNTVNDDHLITTPPQALSTRIVHFMRSVMRRRSLSAAQTSSPLEDQRLRTRRTSAFPRIRVAGPSSRVHLFCSSLRFPPTDVIASRCIG